MARDTLEVEALPARTWKHLAEAVRNLNAGLEEFGYLALILCRSMVRANSMIHATLWSKLGVERDDKFRRRRYSFLDRCPYCAEEARKKIHRLLIFALDEELIASCENAGTQEASDDGEIVIVGPAELSE